MMTQRGSGGSSRREELLEACYAYVLDHGLADMSLRPIAGAVGSSPRVLLFLFGSKEGLVRALLARARRDELELLERFRDERDPAADDLIGTAHRVWTWLSQPEHRRVLHLWVEAYARSLVAPDGPWGGFATATVDEWLHVLADAQPAAERHTDAARARRTLVLAVLRGAMLDLLATGDAERTGDAVRLQLAALEAADREASLSAD